MISFSFLKKLFVAGLIVITLPALSAFNKEKLSQRGNKDSKNKPIILSTQEAKNTNLSIVLGCPTDNSVVASILSVENFYGYIEYGTSSGNYSNKTDTFSFTSGKPTEIVLNKLQSNTRYYYQLINEAMYKHLLEGSFQTQRAPGSTFVFDVQGDSHPERPKENDPKLYTQTLRAAAAITPTSI